MKIMCTMMLENCVCTQCSFRDKENVFFIIEKVRSALKGWNAKFAKEQEEKAKTAAKTGHKRTRFSITVGNARPNNLNVYGNEG